MKKNQFIKKNEGSRTNVYSVILRGAKETKKLYKKTGKRGTKKIRTKKKIQNKNKSQTSKKKIRSRTNQKIRSKTNKKILRIKPTKNIKN